MIRDGTAQTRDGVTLAYSLHGSPDAPARVALAHSLAMDRSFWVPVAGRLAGADGCVLAYDCRGHGASDKPPGPYRVEGFADDLADLLSAVGWGKAVVGGASMGGCVALAFAQRHRARVRGLGLFDTTAWYGAGAAQAWEERAQKGLSEGLAALAPFQASRWFADDFEAREPHVARHALEVFLANDRAAYAQSCRLLGACDLRPGLADVTAPTRIVVGAEDYATPVAMAEALRAGLSGSSLRIIPGARHLTPLERPDIVAEELRALLQEQG
jgi:3-oxoadipate enol-lactonase